MLEHYGVTRGELARRRPSARRTSASPRRRASSAAPSRRSPPTRTSSRWNGAVALERRARAGLRLHRPRRHAPGLLALHGRGGRGGPARGRRRLPLSRKSGDCRNRRSCGVVQDEAAERERRIPSDRRRSMPQYALLIYHPEGRNPSREEMYEEHQRWQTYTQELVDAGQYKSSQGLKGVESATTVRVRDGETPGHRRPVRRDQGVPRRLLPDRGRGPRRGARRGRRGCPAPSTASVEVRPVMAWRIRADARRPRSSALPRGARRACSPR